MSPTQELHAFINAVDQHSSFSLEACERARKALAVLEAERGPLPPEALASARVETVLWTVNPR